MIAYLKTKALWTLHSNSVPIFCYIKITNNLSSSLSNKKQVLSRKVFRSNATGNAYKSLCQESVADSVTFGTSISF